MALRIICNESWVSLWINQIIFLQFSTITRDRNNHFPPYDGRNWSPSIWRTPITCTAQSTKLKWLHKWNPNYHIYSTTDVTDIPENNKITQDSHNLIGTWHTSVKSQMFSSVEMVIVSSVVLSNSTIFGTHRRAIARLSVISQKFAKNKPPRQQQPDFSNFKYL